VPWSGFAGPRHGRRFAPPAGARATLGLRARGALRPDVGRGLPPHLVSRRSRFPGQRRGPPHPPPRTARGLPISKKHFASFLVVAGYVSISPFEEMMVDTVSKLKRSQVMASIRSYGNQNTELKLIGIFRANGITGWRRKQAVVGKPDFIFRSHRLAIFVDGCFWHGCSRHCRMPKTRVSYWTPKIASNKRRDRTVSKRLRELGWTVLRIWEHSLRFPVRVAIRVKKTLNSIDAQRGQA